MEIEIFIVALIMVSRALLPLVIPRYPLPAIIACLVLDGVDQTIMQTTTSIDLSFYQQYDKAFDIYYLAIAYLSTLRNWTNQSATQIARVLFYYRIVGVMLFELTEWRGILFLFPNIFEYFFIAYEVIRSKWDVRKVGLRFWLSLAFIIWAVVKVPQEYILHIAQIDSTEWLNENIFRRPIDAPMSTVILDAPLQTALIAVVIFVVVLGSIYMMRRFAPPMTEKLRLYAPLDFPAEKLKLVTTAMYKDKKLLLASALEKTTLSTLLIFIFAYLFNDVNSSLLITGVGIFMIVLANIFLEARLVSKYKYRYSINPLFEFLFILGTSATVVYTVKYYFGDGRFRQFSDEIYFVLFYLTIVALITMLYDRHCKYYLRRWHIV